MIQQSGNINEWSGISLCYNGVVILQDKHNCTLNFYFYKEIMFFPIILEAMSHTQSLSHFSNFDEAINK